MDYQTLQKNFENHRFKTSYFATGAEAADYLQASLHGLRIGFGGCMTAKELALDERLAADNTLVWHWLVNDRATRLAARDTDVFILSANAVAATGELVNIDGTGNRLAASLYGPARVIYLVGKNKITPDLPAAMRRARDVASYKNACRFGKNTPCVAAGHCCDCNSPDRICNATLILERPCTGMEVEIIFIDEDMGY